MKELFIMRLIYKGLEADTYTDDKFVYKIYPSKSIDKISNETKLLNLSIPAAVIKLKCGYAICTEYINFFNLMDESPKSIVDGINSIFDSWKDEKYSSIVKRTWDLDEKNYYISIIQKYVPEEVKAIDYFIESKPIHFVHGDFTLSNIKSTQEHKITVIDYAHSFWGPAFFDEATFAYSLIKNHYYELSSIIMERFKVPISIIKSICVMKLAVALKNKDKEEVKMRYAALKYIESIME